MKRINGTAGDDHLDGDDGANSMFGFDGDDVLFSYGGEDWLAGGAGNDYLVGGTGSDRLIAGSGDDEIYGLEDNDTISGGAGSDQLTGGQGSDVISGGSGRDFIYGDEGVSGAQPDSNDLLSGGGGNDSISGGEGNDTLEGDAGDDELIGGTGRDVLNGGAGNDYLTGYGEEAYGPNRSPDTISGGTGDDRIVVRYADSVDGGADFDTVDLYLLRAAHGLTLDFRSQASSGTILIDDTTVTNIESVDTITLTRYADVMIGIATGDGRLVDGFGGDDVLTESTGVDLIYGGDGNDTIDCGTGGLGASSGDRAYGDDGDDHISIGTDGALGSGGRGDDTVSGGAGIDAIAGDGGDDLLSGDGGNDGIQGGDGRDDLDGGLGDDGLNGGNGNDRLIGGGGADMLTGGFGADRFIFRDGDVASSLGNADTIKDFARSDHDKIDLIGLDSDTTSDQPSGFDFIGARAFSGVAGELRYEPGSFQTVIEGDTDGDSIADFAILLTGSVALRAGDFVGLAGGDAMEAIRVSDSAGVAALDHATWLHADPQIPVDALLA